MLRLTYRSYPTAQMARDDVAALVRHARNRNDADNITGLLVYDGQSFFQILEGDPDSVEACFSRIEADRWHRDITVMGRHTIADRAFKRWRMGSVVYDCGS